MKNERPIDMQSRLKEFIEAESGQLLASLRLYVIRAGLAYGTQAADVAADLFSEMTLEVLENAERFRPEGQPMTWMLGIAANLIRRRQVDRAKRNRREPLVRDLYLEEGQLSEEEAFDRLDGFIQGDPTHSIETEQQLSAWLGILSPEDQHIVRLAVVHELNGEGMAQALHITPGAARVRLHRALNRLRQQAPLEAAEGRTL